MTGPTVPVLEVDLGPRVRAGFTLAQVPQGHAVPAEPGAGEGFNLSLSVGDDPGAVARRRRALAGWVGATPVWARQVHGADVVRVSAVPATADPIPAADALVTRLDEVAPAVLAADCVPVLLADPGAQVVGAVHAGRGGLVAGVVQAAVRAMVDLGARTEHLRAVVGPAVCGRCYEVPAELRDEVDARVPGTASSTSWGTPSLDLVAGVRGVLVSAGVGVEVLDACTFTDPRWYSHRAAGVPGSERPVGRIAGVVRLL